jgi:hypothetical protein
MNALPVAAASPNAGLSALHDVLVTANINPKTGLSTDYMNHFNEMVMLIQLFPTAPDVAEEILAWQPRNYCEHFEHSGFRSKALALLGYQMATPALTRALEAIVAEIDTVLLNAQELVATASEAPETALALEESVEAVETQIARASALINGVAVVADAGADDAQAAVDALFGG